MSTNLTTLSSTVKLDPLSHQFAEQFTIARKVRAARKLAELADRHLKELTQAAS